MDRKKVITTTVKGFLQSLLFASSLLLCTHSYALPPEFTATYQAKAYGMIVAEATYKLTHKKDGISFSQHSEPVGMAALFTDDVLDENCELTLHGDQLLLNQYSFIQTGDNKDRDIQLSINWQQNENDQLAATISGIARGQKVELETSGPVWDTLSFQIPVMLYTQESNPPQEHNILVKGDLKSYLFITHGVEDIDINGRFIKTIKVERKSDKEEEPIFFWVAPGLNNLPIKIEKWRNNKPGITMLLNDASFPSDDGLQFHAAEELDNDFE